MWELVQYLSNEQICYFFPIMPYQIERICSCYAEKKGSIHIPIGGVKYQMFVAWKRLQLEAQNRL